MLNYCNIDDHDLKEITEFAEDLTNYFAESKYSGLSRNILIKISASVSLSSLILSFYSEIKWLSEIMTEFSILINEYKDKFLNLSLEQIELLEGFTHNFEVWIQQFLFNKHSDISYLNNSFRGDLDTIKLMLNPMEYSEDIDSFFF